MRLVKATRVGLVACLIVAAMLGGGTSQAGALPTSGDPVECAEVVFVGARESGQNPGFHPSGGGHGPTVWRTFETLQEGIGSERTLAQRWLDYPALGTGTLFNDHNPSDRDVEYMKSVTAGHTRLLHYVDQLAERCNSWIVLVGYSQGALAVRLALESLTGTPAIDQIGGIALFGDPARYPADGLTKYGGANQEMGIYTNRFEFVNPVPPTVGFRSSWCLPADDICENNGIPSLVDDWLFDDSPHGQYLSGGSAALAGYWLAEDLLELDRRPRPAGHGLAPPTSPADNDADDDGFNDGVDPCPNAYGRGFNGCPTPDEILIGNFDGVGNDDIMLVRPDDGKFDFYVDTNQVANHEIAMLDWGLPGDWFHAGQFGGGAADDILLVRKDGGKLDFYFEHNFDTPHEHSILNWGLDTDSVLIGDFDGDGTDDIMLVRFDGAKWDFYFETTMSKPHDATFFNWGLAGDYLHVGDFNADGQEDLMLLRPDDGKFDFYVDTNQSTPHEASILNWGLTGDQFFVGSFGGSSDDDILLVRKNPSNYKHDWYFERNLDTPDDHTMFNWGLAA